MLAQSPERLASPPYLGRRKGRQGLPVTLSSRVYWIPSKSLREMGVELTVRARTNAYRHLSNLTQLQREERYDALKTSIREKGFLEGNPIIVLLNRPEFGVDMLLQGHHRLNIAIELNIDLVPVRFAYVSDQ